MMSTTGFGRVGSDTTISTPRLARSGFLGRLENHVLAPAAATLELDGHGFARLEAAHDFPELVDGADGASIDLEDEVAPPGRRRLGRAALGYIGDDHAPAATDTEGPGDVSTQRLGEETDPRPCRHLRAHGVIGGRLS